MIKDVSIISSKGLNPYSATWVSGDSKQEVKSEDKPGSAVIVQESKPVQEKQDVVQISTNPAPSNSDKMVKTAVAAAGASVVLSAAGIIAGRKNAKAISKAASNFEEVKAAIEELKSKTVTAETIKENVKNSNKKLVAALAAALGLGAGGAAGTALAGGKSKDPSIGLDDEALQKLENAGAGIKNKLDQVNGKADLAIVKSSTGANVTDGRTQEMKSHSANYHGLNLLIYRDEGKVVDKTKNALAYEGIRGAAEHYVNRTAAQAMSEIKDYRKDYGKYLDLDTIWSVTAEFEPIKAGGLGVVPKELQTNFTNLGLDNPTFIPMYLAPGKGELKQVFNPERPNDYVYYYKNNAFNVTKFATMPIKKYSGTIPQTQKVEFFLGYVDEGGAKLKPIVFVNDNETFSTDLYNNGMQGQEKMKFAMLDKAVYQLAKQKISESVNKVDKSEGKPENHNTGCPEIVINDKDAYARIKTPSSMILNDWHAAGIAGLMRYKAPLENSHNEISDTASVVMKKMPLLMIGHNAGEPGATWGDDALTENVINTLYDGYAYGITENAASGYFNHVEGNEALNKRLIDEENYGSSIFFDRNNKDSRQFNNLAHGVALSDWFVPVSRNYSKELMSGEQNSGMAAGLIEKRARAGQKKSDEETLKQSTVYGIVNGLDVAANNIEKKSGFIEKITKEPPAQYKADDTVEDIKAARAHNKMLFGEKFILQELLSEDTIKKNNLLTGNDPDKNVKIAELDKKMTELTDKFHKEFNEEIPVISFAHRLTHQKGLDIFTGAVKKLYNEWDKNEKLNKHPRPFIVMGGPPDDPNQLIYMDQMKESSNFTESAQKDTWKIITKSGNMPNPLIYAGSTFFCGPSTFEPCGLIQGESFAMGTPVIVNKTGGYVDTVIDKADADKANTQKRKELKLGPNDELPGAIIPNGFVAPYDSMEVVKKSCKEGDDVRKKWLDKAIDSYYNKMVEALDFYYTNQKGYDQMVKNNLNIDFSWNQGKSNDSIHQYLDRLGVSDDELEVFRAQRAAKLAQQANK